MRRRHGNRKSPAKTVELLDVSANSKKADHKPRLRGYDILQQVDDDPVDLIRSAANSVGIPRDGAPLGQCFEPGYRVGNRRPPGGALANFSTRPDSKKKSWRATKSGEVPIASEVAPQKNDAEGWILVRQPRRKKGEGVTSLQCPLSDNQKQIQAADLRAAFYEAQMKSQLDAKLVQKQSSGAIV